MKRILALALLVSLLLCACGEKPVAPTQPETQPAQTQTTAATEATTEAPTQAPTQAPTEPSVEETTAPAKVEKVTVYLLEKSFLCDSGSTEYSYDENGNIISCKIYTMENDLMYTTYFEEPDANGMAGVRRDAWGDGADQCRTLVWEADGKLKEEQFDTAFSGYQYEYDESGHITEKREYYEGILVSVVYYTYTDGVLSAVHNEDPQGVKQYDCRVENGKILEKTHYTSEGTVDFSYSYEYDKKGRLVASTFTSEGATEPSETFQYRKMQVDPARVPYLMSQQNYLLSIT